MDITPKTKLGKLLDDYPFLVEFLSSLAPEYSKLKNPILRRTMTKVATLEMVAAIGGIETKDLISKIEAEVGRRNNAVKDKVQPEGSSNGEGPEDRKEILKGIILDLHRGADMAELQKRFEDLIEDISPEEISKLEQSLIEDGMPESEVKRLCDVHVGIFRKSLDRQKVPQAEPGHPVHTFMLENMKAENLLGEITSLLSKLGDSPDQAQFMERKVELMSLLEDLSEIDKHYLRKENQLFPALETHGVSGPTQVMWAIHDDIRGLLKKTKIQAKRDELQALATLRKATQMIADMIYKEEHILFPMSLETLTEEDWVKVRHGEEEIGYAWIEPPSMGKPSAVELQKGLPQDLALETGTLSLDQVNLMLTHLPVDLTFVDENDEVRYYSQTKERIFPRSPGIIGRRVQKCHPPKSVHIVNKILDEFKAGRKDVAEFWIQMAGRLIHIRYLAVRDSKNRYKGTLEVSQDVTHIKELEGERRLLDWE